MAAEAEWLRALLASAMVADQPLWIRSLRRPIKPFTVHRLWLDERHPAIDEEGAPRPGRTPTPREESTAAPTAELEEPMAETNPGERWRPRAEPESEPPARDVLSAVRSGSLAALAEAMEADGLFGQTARRVRPRTER